MQGGIIIILVACASFTGCTGLATVHDEASITIEAPAEVVWTWVSDPAHYQIWNPHLSEYTVTGDQDGHVGTTFRLVEEENGYAVTIDAIVTEWEEQRRFAFRGRSASFDLTCTYTMHPADTGCTVTCREERQFRGILSVLTAKTEGRSGELENVTGRLERLKSEIDLEMIDEKYSNYCRYCGPGEEVPSESA